MDFRELVTIRNFRDLHEAHLPRASLDPRDSSRFLADETWYIWMANVNCLGGVKLQVAAADARSQEISKRLTRRRGRLHGSRSSPSGSAEVFIDSGRRTRGGNGRIALAEDCRRERGRVSLSLERELQNRLSIPGRLVATRIGQTRKLLRRKICHLFNLKMGTPAAACTVCARTALPERRTSGWADADRLIKLKSHDPSTRLAHGHVHA